jgi:CRISPR/Cas system CMR-associated protein Cmr5 small subunit
VTHADALRGQRLGFLIARRQSLAPVIRNNYLNMAIKLPHWLHHNGLAQTLDYFAVLKDRGAETAAAADCFLQDWFNVAGSDQGLHLVNLMTADTPPTDQATYRMASRLAALEACWFKRLAQSLLADPAATSLGSAASADATVGAMG